MRTTVVVQFSVNWNTCQRLVDVEFVCVVQQITVKGTYTVQTRLALSFQQTLPKKKWQGSLVKTVACARLVVLVTMLSATTMACAGSLHVLRQMTNVTPINVVPVFKDVSCPMVLAAVDGAPTVNHTNQESVSTALLVSELLKRFLP